MHGQQNIKKMPMSLFSNKNPIIRISSISGLLAVLINPHKWSYIVHYKVSMCVSLITLHTSRWYSKFLPSSLKHCSSDCRYTCVRYHSRTSKSRIFFLSERYFAKSLQKIQWWEVWTSWRPHPQPRIVQSSDWEIRYTGFFLNHDGTCLWNEVSRLSFCSLS